MAQAFRKKTDVSPDARQTPELDSFVVVGTYTSNLKITVEWERRLSYDGIVDVLKTVLAEPRTFRDIHQHLSSHCHTTDQFLPPGKISNYRVSTTCTKEIVLVLERRATIVRIDNDAAGGGPRWVMPVP